jgi:hypothetical protein
MRCRPGSSHDHQQQKRVTLNRPLRVAFATPNATGLLTPEALLNGERESFETENESPERNPGVLGVRRLELAVRRESGPEARIVASRCRFTGKRKTPRAGGSRRFV